MCQRVEHVQNGKHCELQRSLCAFALFRKITQAGLKRTNNPLPIFEIFLQMGRKLSAGILNCEILRCRSSYFILVAFLLRAEINFLP